VLARSCFLALCLTGCAVRYRPCISNEERMIEQRPPLQDAARYCAEAAREPDSPPAAPGLARVPYIVREIAVRYPEPACGQGQQAVVTLKVFLSETGAVARASVIESAGSPFDEVAEDALMRFQFTPACSVDGSPVRSQLLYRYKFLMGR
jgi:TonB family protein